MATRDVEALDRTLAALADPTRRAMLERLAKNGRMAISDLATPFTMSLPAILKHVGVLAEAKLVSRVKIGRTVYCHLLSPPIRTAITWLRKYEDYQAPAEAAAPAPARKGAKAASKTKRAAATATRQKQAAPKAAAKKARAKTVERASTTTRARSAKTKAAGRRAKAATSPALRRAGRPIQTARRAAKPAAAAGGRRRPRR